jgi:predicted transcriptional regulator
MNNRRASVEVIADVLRLGRAGKTEIMYSCNLSHRQLRQYLDFLSSRGFIHEEKQESPKTTYSVTPKGRALLSNLEGVLSQLSLRDLN